MTEVLLFDTPTSVYIKTNEKLKNQRVIVSFNDNLELGLVKGNKTIEVEKDIADFIRIASTEDNQKRCENCKYALSTSGYQTRSEQIKS